MPSDPVRRRDRFRGRPPGNLGAPFGARALRSSAPKTPLDGVTAFAVGLPYFSGVRISSVGTRFERPVAGRKVRCAGNARYSLVVPMAPGLHFLGPAPPFC